MADWQVIHGDALDVMRGMEAESVGAVVTDPQYGIRFMGHAWDDKPPGREIVEECLRVLKPGGHFVAFGGTRTYHRLACAVEDAGFEIRDMLAWIYGQGFPKSLNLDGEWKGWGTALKPAHEPIVLARKPLAGTVARNVQEHGTGAVNVDGCRVPASPNDRHRYGIDGDEQAGIGYHGLGGRTSYERPEAGRWPPNVLLDDEAAEEVDRQSGDAGGRDGREPMYGRRPSGFGNVGAERGDREPNSVLYGDSGGASRFFPRFRYVEKASRSERGNGNTHPTVKPVKLMQWLVRLVTPPGGLVLDPFAGSGSTLVAATRLGFRCIGVEREEEYVKIARRRLEGDAPLFNWRAEEAG